MATFKRLQLVVRGTDGSTNGVRAGNLSCLCLSRLAYVVIKRAPTAQWSVRWNFLLEFLESTREKGSDFWNRKSETTEHDSPLTPSQGSDVPIRWT